MSESKVPTIAAATTSKNKRRRRGSGEGASVASSAAVTSVASGDATSVASGAVTSVASTAVAAGTAAASTRSTTAAGGANILSGQDKDDLAEYFEQFEVEPKGTRAEWETLIETAERFQEIVSSKAEAMYRQRGNVKSSTDSGRSGSNEQQQQQEQQSATEDSINEEGVDFQTNKDWKQLVDGCKRLGVDSLDFERVTSIHSTHLDKIYFYIDHFILKPLQGTNKKIQQTDEELKAYTRRSTKTETAGSVVTEINEEDFAEMMQGVHIQSPLNPVETINDQIGRSDNVFTEPWWKAKSPKGDTLRRFSIVWNKLVLGSTKFSSSDYQKKHRFMSKQALETINEVINWNNGLLTKSNRRDSRTDYSSLYFPDCAVETETVRPLIAALTHALNQIDPEEEDEEDQTGKTLSNKFERQNKRHKPDTNLCTDVDSMTTNIFKPDHDFKLAKIVKNVCRVSIGADALRNEAEFQILSPLGKRCLDAFNVAGVGIDADSVGLIITPVYVQVVRLRLQNMSIDSVNVVVDRTAMFPLVNKEALAAFVTNEDDREFLKNQLYPSTDFTTSSNAQSGGGDCEPPQGMAVLWQLIHCNEEDIGVSFFNNRDPVKAANYISSGSTGDEVAKIPQVIDKCIGSGSQGIVYGLAGDERQTFVVKTSVFGQTRYIKREIEALQRLSVGAEMDAKFVAKMEGFGLVEYKIRSVIAKTPAIMISPRGIPADSFLLSQPKFKTDLLLRLWSNGQSALTYAHKKRVFHLDVCPRNFIFSHDSNVFVLIDWGCSFCECNNINNKPVVGFRGSLPFAHAKIHDRKHNESWRPHESFDDASLLFTICALREGSAKNPFEGFHEQILWKKDKKSEYYIYYPFKQREEKTRTSLNGLLSARQYNSFLHQGTYTTTEGPVPLYGHDVSGTIDKKKRTRIMGMVDRCLDDA